MNDKIPFSPQIALKTVSDGKYKNKKAICLYRVSFGCSLGLVGTVLTYFTLIRKV